jgi:cell division protein FtsZ
MGDALMGTGVATGDDRAVQAAQTAIRSPLLDDVSIKGAKGVLVNITGGDKMTLHEVSQATAIISQEAGEDANVIFGAVVNKGMAEEIQVTVIATGFEPGEREILPLREPEAAAEPRSAEIINIRDLDEAPTPVEIDNLARSGVGYGAAHYGAYHEPNLDIPTFLRKQLD